MIKKYSFKKHILVKKGKKVFVYILDFFLNLMLTTCLFVGVDLIGNKISNYEEKQEEISLIKNDLINLVESTKLGKSSNGSLISKESYVSDFIKSLTLYTLKENYEEKNISSIYFGVDVITPETDGVYFYFTTFISQESDNYKVVNSKTIESYINEYCKDYSYFEEGLYPYLNKESADAINSYLLDESYSKGEVVYTNIYNSYYLLLEEGIEDYSTNYMPYIKMNESYDNLVIEIYNQKFIEIILSFLLSSIILYIFLPLILKGGQTLSFRAFKVGLTTKDDDDINFINILIKFIFNIFKEFLATNLVIFLVYGSDLVVFYKLNFLGINFSVFSLISLFLIIINGLFLLFPTKYKNNLEEFLSFTTLKDLKEISSDGPSK